MKNDRQHLEDIVSAIQREHIDKGTAARLRRHPAGPVPLAFWKVLSDYADDQIRDEEIENWRLAAFVLASLAEQHDTNSKLGEALAQKLSETRFERLMQAQGKTFAATLRGAVHVLASARKPVDAVALAHLALTAPDAPLGRKLRRELARQYFSAIHTKDKES